MSSLISSEQQNSAFVLWSERDALVCQSQILPDCFLVVFRLKIPKMKALLLGDAAAIYCDGPALLRTGSGCGADATPT